MDEPLDSDNWGLIAPSPLPYLPKSQVPREMTRADMELVCDQFVAATRMAERAGFDLLELHCAHGYLLASFISPLTNVRRDEYGRGDQRIRRREQHHPGRPGRPLRARAGAPLRPRMDSARCRRPGSRHDVARAVPARQQEAADGTYRRPSAPPGADPWRVRARAAPSLATLESR